jgi:hypothetical protein
MNMPKLEPQWCLSRSLGNSTNLSREIELAANKMERGNEETVCNV